MQFTQEDLIELGEIIAWAQRPGVKAALQELVRSQHEVGKSGGTCANRRWRQRNLGAESICREDDMLGGSQGSFCGLQFEVFECIQDNLIMVLVLRQLPS